MHRSAVKVQFNETCAVSVAAVDKNTAHIVIPKGFLTTGHRMLQNNQSAEVYRDAHHSVMISRTADDGLEGVVYKLDDHSVQIIDEFACKGTRFVQAGTVVGLRTLGLHFARRVRLCPSLRVALALLADPDTAPAEKAVRAAFGSERALDFCVDPTRNAFASLYHFNRATMDAVAAASARPNRHIQTELALVACLCAALAAAPAAPAAAPAAPAAARGAWCTRRLRRVAHEAPAAEPTLQLTVQTPLGVRVVRGVFAPDASYWMVPGDVLRVPCGVENEDAGGAGEVGGHDADGLHATVRALRAAAAGLLQVAAVPYVHQNACLRQMSVCEVAISMLSNNDCF